MSELFVQEHQDKHARSATLTIAHASLPTPVFMPVATQGTLKALSHREVTEIGYQIILANTYHLYLRPGTEILKHFGGLHAFTRWDKGYLTDSGGFQVMSLKKFCKIYEDGAKFSSHIDGSKHFFTPELVVSFQQLCGSDIIMPLDVCTPYDVPYKEALNSLLLTQRWLSRSKKTWRENIANDALKAASQLFGIVQGGIHSDLRIRACEELEELPGIALGGLCLGESVHQLSDIVALCREHLPRNKPLYCMGIGSPEYLLAAIEEGADMFDCVFPTRIARNASIFTHDGRINVLNSQYKYSKVPIDHVNDHTYPYTLGYLHHLFKTKEIMACNLASQHNLIFLFNLMQDARKAIQANTFSSFKQSFLERYSHAKI